MVDPSLEFDKITLEPQKAKNHETGKRNSRMKVIPFPVRNRNHYTQAAVEQHLHEVAQGALDMIAESISATARTQHEVRVQMIHILEKLGEVAQDLKTAES